MAERRMLKLRYPARCTGCGADIERGTLAWRDALTKQISCEACRRRDPSVATHLTGQSASGQDVSNRSPIDRGVAGRSAQRRYDRQVAKRDRDVRTRYPIIGGALLALSDEPQHTRAWAAGATGERAVGQVLDSLCDRGVVSLHDRRNRGTGGNIDHIAIAPTGIYIIDAKYRERGRVAKRPEGPIWNRGPGRLYVGKRDYTSLVGKLAGQVSAVMTAVHQVRGARVVPIHSMLVFVDAEWGLFAAPFDLAGVWVGSPRAMAKTVGRPGPMGNIGIDLLARAIAAHLTPA